MIHNQSGMTLEYLQENNTLKEESTLTERNLHLKKTKQN